MKKFLISGTDTSVGKSIFTSTLAYHLDFHQKLNVRVSKPFCTGDEHDIKLLTNSTANNSL